MAGGRIDDLSLKRYPETLDAGSPTVKLLTPVGSDFAYYALYGWTPAGDLSFDAVPGPNTQWSVASGDVLAPGKPVGLLWDNGAGLVFSRQIAVDDHYLFTVTDTVQNNTAAEVRLVNMA